eukprot:TRINITY_DN1972_c0_g1_i3.p1 TRINITY_DN1972_c0_g1~~TRINITY_DN1972_c0_g1_i3.p1  ORF type:complete len:263 (+),score=46.48 TRINITY_DN1972_c0_g1_i3:936-1724(+)
MERLARKLEALRYPYQWDDAELTIASVREMIIWLEDQKIRWWQPNDREVLKAETEVEFMKGLLEYCKDVGYGGSFAFTPGMDLSGNRAVLMMLDWIVGKGVRLEYSDKAQSYNSAHAKYRSLGMSNVTKINSGAEVDDDLNIDLTDKESMLMSANNILAMLDCPASSDLEQALFTISTVTSDIQVFASLKNNITLPTTDSMIKSLPTEFFGDPTLEKCIKLLRHLFVSDHRELQFRISQIIAELQSTTANIKVNTEAGVVGR